MGVEMHHREFLDIRDDIVKRGILFFQVEGRTYATHIEKMYVATDTGRTVMVFPEIFVKEAGEFVELQENGPHHLCFNWFLASYEWLSGEPEVCCNKLCIRTEDGPLYICLVVEEVEEAQTEPVADVA